MTAVEVGTEPETVRGPVFAPEYGSRPAILKWLVSWVA